MLVWAHPFQDYRDYMAHPLPVMPLWGHLPPNPRARQQLPSGHVRAFAILCNKSLYLCLQFHTGYRSSLSALGAGLNSTNVRYAALGSPSSFLHRLKVLPIGSFGLSPRQFQAKKPVKGMPLMAVR